MKLYFSPGACSLAAHIVATEAGVPVETVRVDLRSHKTATGEDYKAINSKGYVPALRLDDGTLLTEANVIMLYLGDRNPASGVVPAAGTPDRYRQQEWLAFISTEVHKNMGSFFNPQQSPEWRKGVEALLTRRLQWLEAALGEKPYLMGDTFSAADAYLAVALNWAGLVKFDVSGFPKLVALKNRVFARPKAIEALKAEGLMG